MKKWFLLLAIAVVTTFAVKFQVQADNAASLDAHTAVTAAYGVGDASSGTVAEVSSKGGLWTRGFGGTVTDSQTGSGEIAWASTVYEISVTAISAGDVVLIYDNQAAAGPVKFDIAVGTANDTKTLSFPNGVLFTRDVFVDVPSTNTNAVVTSVVYDVN